MIQSLSYELYHVVEIHSFGKKSQIRRKGLQTRGNSIKTLWAAVAFRPETVRRDKMTSNFTGCLPLPVSYYVILIEGGSRVKFVDYLCDVIRPMRS